MSVSKGRLLLRLAEVEPSRLKRHLLVAAALREILPDEPVVVGGTAEEYWTAAAYHETDLDVCVPIDAEGRNALVKVGFALEGRHWVRKRLPVAVEIPGSYIDGEEERTVLEPVESGWARIIGLDDLYLDRLRQTTATESTDYVHFDSALAVAAARHDRIEWKYVRRQIRTLERSEPALAAAMLRMDSRIRRRVRRGLAGAGTK